MMRRGKPLAKSTTLSTRNKETGPQKIGSCTVELELLNKWLPGAVGEETRENEWIEPAKGKTKRVSREGMKMPGNDSNAMRGVAIDAQEAALSKDINAQVIGAQYGRGIREFHGHQGWTIKAKQPN